MLEFGKDPLPAKIKLVVIPAKKEFNYLDYLETDDKNIQNRKIY
jgi:hypothetical protein